MVAGYGARTLGTIRRELAVRLLARRGELDEAIVARLRGMSDPMDVNDAEYASSLHAAVAAATDDALFGIEAGDAWPASLPSAVAAHARLVARSGIRLETSLRRAAAAERVREEFLIEEAAGVPPRALREILHTRGLRFDRLMASFADEYRGEAALLESESSLEMRRGELVRRMLDGAPAEPEGLAYDFNCWHLGIVAAGPGAGMALRRPPISAGFQWLCVVRDQETAWGWIGGVRRVSASELHGALLAAEIAHLSLAVGEPGRGIDGWRLTHRQAQAALWVALHRRGTLTRYADELLLIAALKDDVLAASLRNSYLAPLEGRRDGAGLAYETLRAYFNSGCNAVSAAASLHVDRHTVERRLHRIEERLDRCIHDCRPELEVALRLEEFGRGRPDRQTERLVRGSELSALTLPA
jgi:hypothetical protein